MRLLPRLVCVAAFAFSLAPTAQAATYSLIALGGVSGFTLTGGATFSAGGFGGILTFGNTPGTASFQFGFVPVGTTINNGGSVTVFPGPTMFDIAYAGFNLAPGHSQTTLLDSTVTISGQNIRADLLTLNFSETLTPVTAVPGPIAGAGLPALFGLAGAWFVRRRKQKLGA